MKRIENVKPDSGLTVEASRAQSFELKKFADRPRSGFGNVARPRSYPVCLVFKLIFPRDGDFADNFFYAIL
jgi:hypothetical protein